MPVDIHALFDELLALVFLECFRSAELPADEWHRYKFDFLGQDNTSQPRAYLRLHQRLRRVPFQVSGICRHWRNVALQTPSLWRHIRLDFDRLMCKEALETIVWRSGAVPLRVILDNVGCSLNDRGSQDYWPWLHYVIGRAETLVVASLNDDGAPDPELFAALSQPTAALVNYDLTVDTVETRAKCPPFTMFLSAPRLRHLRWKGPDLLFGDFHAAFPALDEVVIRCEVLRVSQLRGWLSVYMPSLRRMTLRGVNPTVVQDVDAESQRAHVPALSTTLEELTICNNLVAAFRKPGPSPLPRLRMLKVTRPHLRCDPTLHILISRCGESLVEVDLEVRLDKEIERVLASLRSLKTLRLVASKQTLAFLSSHALSLLVHVQEIVVFDVLTTHSSQYHSEFKRISEGLGGCTSPRSLMLVHEYGDVLSRIVVAGENISSRSFP
ncbi:hypothetical protein AURDEDRAFT_175646 [Auricularia subglabra TFB-10046 SS5]|uniref:F-box domain-containing protein n=1 Tax=Auricularia subglabra (strain TFB-10046 / SS5) TaxID=717982 RepID=J0WSV1_AURST|nr:hypothetical protein AURDEDRAFT_175646 [Auricularia subglabra TFB-10046 SS5]